MNRWTDFINLIKKTYHMAGPEESKVVLFNAASLTWLQFFTYLLPLIVLPYLFRVLGPEKFGLIAFAQAFTQYFVILTDYGFNISATKEISLCHHESQKISKVYASVMTVKTLLALVSLLVLCLTVIAFPKFQQDPLVYLLSFGSVIGAMLFPGWFLQGIEKMQYIAFLNILGELVYAASIFTFVRATDDYPMVPLAGSCAFLATGFLGQYLAFRKFGVFFKFPSTKKILEQLQKGWNVFISIVAINCYTTTRVFAVGLMTDNTLTGFYSIAERIANVAQTFPLSSFSQAIFPRLSKIFQKNKVRALAIMRQVQQITVNIALIFLPLLVIASPWIVRAVCGGTYPQTVLTLRYLLISVFFVSANAFPVQFLLVSNNSKLYSRIHIGMALIGMPLIFAMIHHFSYAGAALATVFIEAGIFAITYYSVKKLFG